MKNIIFAISSLLISTMVFSCEKDIILDIAPGENDPVVESWIYDNSGPLVMLSRQFSGYGSFQQATLTDSLNIKNATISVSENNGPKTFLVEQDLYGLPQDLLDQFLDAIRTPRIFSELVPFLAPLTLDEQIAFVEQFFSGVEEESERNAAVALIIYINTVNFYIDTTNTIIGKGGFSYELEIEVNGKQISAITTIPLKQDINFLTYDIDQDDPNFAQVKVNLTVPDNFDAFVLLANRKNDSSAYYIPDYFGGGLSDNGIYAGSGTITLPLLRGYGDNENADVSIIGLFEVGDKVTLKWQNIDEATYRFWFSVFNDGGDTPFSAATIIQGNINGGFGIWAGYNTSYTTIQIQ